MRTVAMPAALGLWLSSVVAEVALAHRHRGASRAGAATLPRSPSGVRVTGSAATRAAASRQPLSARRHGPPAQPIGGTRTISGRSDSCLARRGRIAGFRRKPCSRVAGLVVVGPSRFRSFCSINCRLRNTNST